MNTTLGDASPILNPFDVMRKAVEDATKPEANPPAPAKAPAPAALLRSAPPPFLPQADGGRVESNPAPTGLASALPAPTGWPAAMPIEAFQGPAGALVGMLKKHTESDDAAILLQFLVGFGNLLGRTVHRLVENRAHYPLLNCCLVGESARARKGTSWGQVQARLVELDRAWAGPANGLTSGEGLIAAVRDPLPEEDSESKYSAPVVRDKRLLVVEEEFSRVLKGSQREGSTLSDVLRAAFDTGSLRVMTKNHPMEATGAHISVIGHITRYELDQVLSRVDCANGFANRFLWVCVRRARFLPLGGQAHTIRFNALDDYLRKSLALAQGRGAMDFTPEAEVLWTEYYARIGRQGLPGVAGQVTARAEALLLRLGLIYAALNQHERIERGDLESAWAVWKYCEASAALLFGECASDEAESLAAELRKHPEGMPRTAISRFFHHNRSKREIERMLGSLQQSGRARAIEKLSPSGRVEERWFAA